MFDRATIKKNARACVSANYWPVVGYTLLACIIVGAAGGASCIPVVGIIVSIFLLPVLTCGFYYMGYRFYKGEKPDMSYMFEGFRDGKFMHVVGGFWYMALFTFLWSLLLIIPGIIKSYAYSMTPFILIDQPEISATDALEKSKKMTEGHKFDIFVFQLSFIGWILLCTITLGLAEIFYVGPYYTIAMGGVYDYLKYLEDGETVDAPEIDEQIIEKVDTAETLADDEAADLASKYENEVASSVEDDIEGNN